MAIAAVVDQATLKANIDGYLRRSFTAGELAQFVAEASSRIGRDLRSTAQQKVGSLRPVGGIAELPIRCAEIRSIQRTSGAQLMAFGANAGQDGSATGDEITYLPMGQNAAGRKQVELWPANTDATATKAVTSLTSVTTLATLTTTADHDLASGVFVDISGVVEDGYNGTVGPITVTSDTVFTFAVDADVNDAPTGTILVKPCTILVHYYEAPDPAFTLGDTNPVLDAHPELYTNACLASAAAYAGDIDKEAKYTQLYVAEKDLINRETKNLAWGSFPAAITNINMAGASPRGL